MDTPRRHARTERQVRNAVLDAASDLRHFGNPSKADPSDRKAYAVLAEDLAQVADRVPAVLPARGRSRYLAALRLLSRAADPGTDDGLRRGYGDRSLRLLDAVAAGFPEGFGEPPAPTGGRDCSLRDEVLARGPELLAIAARRGIAGLVLFGSVARGEDDGESDIDFAAIPGDSPVTLFDLVGFSQEAGRLLSRPVSAVIPGPGSRIAGDVERDGVSVVG